VRISELVYPSDLLVLQQFFQSTSMAKSIRGLIPSELFFPEYACSKFIQLIDVPHIRCDNITIIYIFKNLYYVMSPTAITYRIYETFFQNSKTVQQESTRMKIIEIWTFQTVCNVKNFRSVYGHGMAGYVLKWAGFRRDIDGVLQLLRT
jgi:hypothetical protein